MPGHPIPTPVREWRCRSCGALLGVCRGDAVEVRYKAAAYVVRGELTAVCRRCGTTNRFNTGHGRQPAAAK